MPRKVKGVEAILDPKDYLIKARESILSGWTQKAAARNSDGRMIVWTSPDAAYVCLAAAIRRACSDGVKRSEDARRLRQKAFFFVAKSIGIETTSLDNQKPEQKSTDVIISEIDSWNDAPGRTKGQVIAALSRSIEAVEAATTDRMEAAIRAWRAATGESDGPAIEAANAALVRAANVAEKAALAARRTRAAGDVARYVLVRVDPEFSP